MRILGAHGCAQSIRRQRVVDRNRVLTGRGSALPVAPAGLVVLSALTLLQVLAPPAPAAVRRPLTVRGWILLHYDMEYLREAIAAAPSFDINHIQLSHGIVHHGEQLIEDQRRQHDVAELARLCHDRGIEIFIWVHELNAVPDEFKTDGRPDLDRAGFWEWMARKYDRLFDAGPTIDGIVVSLSEGQYHVYSESRVGSKLSPAERVTKLLEVMSDVCRRRGKKIYCRTFGESPFARQGIFAAPPDVFVMSKVTNGDWQPYSPHNIATGYFRGSRPEIVEFDLAGEYMGHGQIPWCCPNYIQYRLRNAVAKGASGVVGRIGRDNHHILGTPSEINLYAFSRLIDDPEADLGSLWRDWVSDKYGTGAVDGVTDALRRTEEITRRLYWGDHLGDIRIQQHSSLPSLSYAESHNRTYMYTPPVDVTLYSQPGALDNDMERRYDAILPLCDASLSDLDRAKAALKEDEYARVRDYLERQRECVRIFRAVHAAFIAWVVYKSDPTPERRAWLEGYLARVDQVADEIERRHPDMWPGNPGRARGFASSIRKRTK